MSGSNCRSAPKRLTPSTRLRAEARARRHNLRPVAWRRGLLALIGLLVVAIATWGLERFLADRPNSAWPEAIGAVVPAILVAVTAWYVVLTRRARPSTALAS